MRKVLLLVGILLFPAYGNVSAESNLEESLILELLTPYVEDAIEEFYGQTRDYDQENIVELEKLDDCQGCFLATIEVRTQIQSLEPPYVTDQISIDVRNGNVTIVDYVHKSE
ncbi:DUF3888 domain-containing protein [Piscibacillus salipiscarius]|uniref:DUF3888 domain-containing protein n=1 Tax=Piscibacillus salipiscarius TaxID=299480 RepID=A0ABW5QCK7_9BACI|nr:DUF3888 domain-containing protein [Piscibacillus salipiscarius]